jgi:hypothetical protein
LILSWSIWRASVLYTGSGGVTVNDLSGLKTNVARIRTEIETLLHDPESFHVIA